MDKINVYKFCMMFREWKEVRLYICKFHLDGTVIREQKTFRDRFDSELKNYRDAEVHRFEALDKGIVEITAFQFC